MRISVVLAAVACSLPLPGCGALGPKPIPEWAMSSRSAAPTNSRKRYTQRSRPAVLGGVHSSNTVDRLSSRQTSMSENRGSRDAESSQTAVSGGELIPFTSEWYAREDGIDARLRRVMRICSTC